MRFLQQLALALFDEPGSPVATPGGDRVQARGPARVAPIPAPQAAPKPEAVDSSAPSRPPLDATSDPREGARRTIVLQGRSVSYALRRARRRTIGFVVGPDGLSVSAPRWVGLREIEAAVQEKAGWILRKLHEQGERVRRIEAHRIVWADGQGVPYLGSTVTLRLDGGRVASPGGAMLECDDEGRAAVLRLGLPADAQADRIRDGVHAWWQRQALRVFEERCALYAPRLGVTIRRLSLTSAQTRWGSASADGSIRLNWRLIQFPVATVDYVVVHELAHLREMNHSPAFWDVVRTVLPGYESAQGPLKQAVPLGD